MKGVLKNSIWGLASQILQNVLLMVFFVIVARNFPKEDFSSYLIANTLYQVMASFSALGLGQWFIRQLPEESDLALFLNKFLKIQIYAGVFFYLVNVGVAFFLYHDPVIRVLTALIGLNIIFDNIIYTVRNLNIAQFEQNKTFKVLTTEAVLKVVLACVVFVYPYTIIEMSVLLVLIRLFTLNLFLRISTSKLATFKSIFFNKVPMAYVKALVLSNWPFIIVGSVSVIYWRIGSILISKFLPIGNVATYEVAFKFFSVAELIPVIVSSTIFAELLRSYREDGQAAFNKLYHFFFKIYILYGFLTFTFLYSFADQIILLGFGKNFADAGYYTKEMFLTMLVFPTAILQANILVVLKLEKKDMWFNIVSLVVNVALALTGFVFLKQVSPFFNSLHVVNLSILISFIVFHLLQDYVLVKKQVSTPAQISYGYLVLILCFFAYVFLATVVNAYLLFIVFWIVVLWVVIATDKRILNFIKEKTGRSASLEEQ
jgi:O-antigen/teichoic acid export membrane protein